MDEVRNKVFINPNFNKRPNNVPMGNVPVMHVNPNFYQHLQNAPLHKPKIYINPNFVRPNSNSNQPVQNANKTIDPQLNPLMDSSNRLTATVSAPTRCKIQASALTYIGHPNYVAKSTGNHPVWLVNSSKNCCVSPNPQINSCNTSTAPTSALKRSEVQNTETNSIAIQPYQTHSRYSLVRHKKSEKVSVNNMTPQTSTIKISKYKSIKITDIKKNLDSVKPIVKVTPLELSNNNQTVVRIHQKVISKTATKQMNRYKLVRPTIITAKAQFKRQISNTPKKAASNRSRIKTVGVYKKNNIPCPQFRKYGKCLRKSHGKCEFLHDRKHVSICRKFLNGVCHNNDCLLSHELSDKKMPTCYFYLKGMCTKDGCPYLHVKLNEKAKVCLDFMRGYCEKGDKCLNRHVAKSLNIGNHKKLILKKVSQQRSMKYKLEKNNVKSNTSNVLQQRKNKLKECHSHDNDAANRYYNEPVAVSNTSENLEIKPMRCKLGTLPSFIQL